MLEKEHERSSHRATTPEGFPTTASSQLPSGDYSYTVELVGTMQNTLGKLTEAVEGLKEQTKQNNTEIRAISQDIHTAKTMMKVVGAIMAAALAFAGWAINKTVDTVMEISQQPPTALSAPPPPD